MIRYACALVGTHKVFIDYTKMVRNTGTNDFYLNDGLVGIIPNHFAVIFSDDNFDNIT